MIPTILSVVAVVVSAFALLIALGSTLRLQRMQLHGTGVPRAGLAAGEPVPVDVLAHLVSAPERFAAGPSVLVFATSTCAPCQNILDELSRLPGMPRDVCVVQRADDDMAAWRARLPGVRFAVDAGELASRAFDVTGYPVLFLIADGRIVENTIGDDRVTLRRFVGAEESGSVRGVEPVAVAT